MSERSERVFRRYFGLAQAIRPEAFGQDPQTQLLHETWRAVDPDFKPDFDPEALWTFDQFEFDHRMREIAAVAAEVAPLPAFQFNYLDIGSFRASQRSIDESNKYIFLDAGLVQFLFLFFCVRLSEIYQGFDADQRREADAQCLVMIDGLRRQDPRVYREGASIIDHCLADRVIALTAVSVSRTIAYFLLAHELGHIALEREEADVAEAELAADMFGLEVFQRLRRRPALEWARVPAGYGGAPLLFLAFLQLVEAAARAETGGEIDLQGYPSARRRHGLARRALGPCDGDDRALYLDLRASLGRLRARMGRRARGESG